jgi:hypothetical protein
MLETSNYYSRSNAEPRREAHRVARRYQVGRFNLVLSWDQYLRHKAIGLLFDTALAANVINEG